MWQLEASLETVSRTPVSNPLRLIAKVGDHLVFVSQNGMFEITAVPLSAVLFPDKKKTG